MKECRSDELQREKCYKAKQQRFYVIVPSFIISTFFFVKLDVPLLLNDASYLLQASRSHVTMVTEYCPQ